VNSEDVKEGRGGALPSPDLVWENATTPTAARFGDVYYSRDGGLAQSRHVFLAGNDLPNGWQNKETFCVAELGFGTGLNFLATWELWRRTRAPGSRLHYVAAEGFPLTGAELGACLAPWQELRPLGDALIAAYPAPQRGFHRVFPALSPHERGEVTLTLLYGDAAEMLTQLEAEVDAWFLDGFAPDKNPQMWSPAIFTQMARLSRSGASAATYSVAGDVRRGLDAAGFDVMRAPGFGGKLEMLRARFRGDGARSSALQPWFARAPRAAARGHAAILGAGLAGAHTAAALARHGWTSTLIDRHDAVAGEASGSPRAVMAPRLTAAPAHDGRFYAAGWRFMLDDLARNAGVVGREAGGSLQLGTDGGAERLAEIAAAGALPQGFLMPVDAKQASDIAGVRLTRGGLFFPQGGWIEPQTLCAALAEPSDKRFGTAAVSLVRNGLRWRVQDAAGATIVDADAVVFANALGMKNFTDAAWLPLEGLRGQVTLTATTPAAEALRAVLLYGGFVTPAYRGVHAVGATFDAAPTSTTNAVVSVEDHARNFASLAEVAPGLLAQPSVIGGFAAVRCMSPDHLPLVGPLPDRGDYVKDFAELRHGHPWARYPNARYQQGLFVLTGLGARGVVSAPLAAELLASHITGAPWPLERDLVNALHPARFLVRELKRRAI
jgi:tRNA 5-methylaminomethyl-2-thiouridine biosynthesis bifunctional protein